MARAMWLPRMTGRKPDTGPESYPVPCPSPSSHGQRCGPATSVDPFGLQGHPVALRVPRDDVEAGSGQGPTHLRLAVDVDAAGEQSAAGLGGRVELRGQRARADRR